MKCALGKCVALTDSFMTTRFLLGYFGVSIVAFMIGAALVWTWARQAIELARVNAKAEEGREREGEVREISARLAASAPP